LLKWNKLNPPIESGKGAPFRDIQRIRAPPKGYNTHWRRCIGIFKGPFIMITPEGLDYERYLLTIWGFLLMRMPQEQ